VYKIIICPVAIKLDKNKKPKIINFFTDIEWEKLLRELKELFKEYTKLYSLEIKKVKKINNNFIEINYIIKNKTKFLFFLSYYDWLLLYFYTFRLINFIYICTRHSTRHTTHIWHSTRHSTRHSARHSTGFISIEFTCDWIYSRFKFLFKSF